MTHTSWLDSTIATPAGRWGKRPNGIRVFIPTDKRTALNSANECPDCGGFLISGMRCDTCLTWAVKNARDFEWARMSWANRGRVWDVLELAKTSQKEAA